MHHMRTEIKREKRADGSADGTRRRVGYFAASKTYNRFPSVLRT